MRQKKMCQGSSGAQSRFLKAPTRFQHQNPFSIVYFSPIAKCNREKLTKLI